MRYFLFLLTIVIASCTTSKQEYDPNVVYIITQTPVYDLYVSKKDVVDYMTQKRMSNTDYDCINKCDRNTFFRISGKEKAYALEFSDIDKHEIADIFEYCAFDLFKNKKVLVYDRHQMKWIDYKIKHVRNVVLDEAHSWYLVISKKNKREIYASQQ